MANVSFKISSALKTIIGKELITDDFIAVFELVKNSFDANARVVEIIFQGLQSDTPCIIIKDNGDGMDDNDIHNKWLFVAYSAKKLEQDYRDKIKPNRIVAGAKGIGRFSCDRLGARLKMVTRKKGEKGAWQVLDVDWSRFEEDPGSEFQTIKARLTETDNSPYPRFQHGTVLEISELRSADWDREKLLKLRRSLERLINPNQNNDAANFSIILTVPEEKEGDKVVEEEKPDEPWNIVNGPVKNFLFEALELKTTQIRIEVDKDILLTRLHDRGTLIYELLENNPYKGLLQDIQINLFFLNRAAKYAFTSRMGLPPVKYGTVFLYKNGFRVHPFGNVGDDSLGIDRRKQQGHYRFLGSRDLSGRIEINKSNVDFQETSSRDGGLIKNRAFDSLKELFFGYALKRLENYVIELLKFGKYLPDLPELRSPDSAELRNFTFDLVVKLTQSKDVIDIHYDPQILNILENRSSESVTALLGNLKRISAEQNNADFSKEIEKAEKQVKVLAKAKEEAEAETEKERDRAEQAEEKTRESIAKAQDAEEAARQAQAEAIQSSEKAKDVTTQNLFLKSVLSKDLVHVIDLHHTIGQDARTIEQFSSNLLGIVKDENKPLKREIVQAVLERINYTARKISTVSRFATHANFRADAEEITADLITYIKEYLLNVYGGFVLDPYQQRIDIQFSAPKKSSFETQFTPINVSIVLDNLISNSRKHKSRVISVSVLEQSEDKLIVGFKDDGKGIPRKNFHSLFQIGFSTTDGSGLGLHHIREIMEEMNGSIIVNEDAQQGAEFILTFNKQ